ncbi:protein phosphatase 2C domain-containing protein [Lachnospiraceae bacterium 62-35]
MEFCYSYNTDIGNTRQVNQDALLVTTRDIQGEKAVLAAVCDGVGGLSHGENASRAAARMLSDWFGYELPQIANQEDEALVMTNRLEQLAQDINYKIFVYGKQNNITLGTTMTAMLFWKNQYYIVHVGDSRAYEIGSSFHQITKDHSFLAREVECGRMTKEEAKADKRKNLILQCLGARAQVKPDILCGSMQEDTVYLLCSDGFWHLIEEEEWTEYFMPSRMTDDLVIHETLQSVVRLVMDRGEKDNITAVALKVSKLSDCQSVPSSEELDASASTCRLKEEKTDSEDITET